MSRRAIVRPVLAALGLSAALTLPASALTRVPAFNRGQEAARPADVSVLTTALRWATRLLTLDSLATPAPGPGAPPPTPPKTLSRGAGYDPNGGF